MLKPSLLYTSRNRVAVVCDSLGRKSQEENEIEISSREATTGVVNSCRRFAAQFKRRPESLGLASQANACRRFATRDVYNNQVWRLRLRSNLAHALRIAEKKMKRTQTNLWSWLVPLACLALVGYMLLTSAGGRAGEFIGKTAPSLDSAGTWINARGPLSWDSLGGKVVWLEFSFLH